MQRIIEYKKRVNEEYNLDDTSRNILRSKISNEEITTKEELRKQITEEKKKTDFRRKLTKIVNEDKILDYFSKRKLTYKISNEEITTKEQFTKEIQKEIRETEIRERNNRKRKLINIVNEEYYLTYVSKRRFISKIENGEITTEEEIRKEIQRIIEYKKIVDTDYNLKASRDILKSKIDNGEITTKEELEKQITEEKKKREKIRTENRKNEWLEIYAHNKYGPLSVLINDRINSGELKTEEEVDWEMKKLKEKNEEQEKERRRKQDLVRSNEKLKNAKYNIGWWSYKG